MMDNEMMKQMLCILAVLPALAALAIIIAFPFVWVAIQLYESL